MSNSITTNETELVVPEIAEANEAAPASPKALEEQQWLQLSPEHQPEALDRAAWLIFRGVPPADALDLATDGMRKDQASTETPFNWPVVIALASRWNGVRRTPDGNYHERILHLAAVVERQAQAEAHEPGAVIDITEHLKGLIPYQAFMDHAVYVYEERLRIIVELKAEQDILLESANYPLPQD